MTMAELEKDDGSKKIVTWVKKDGKTEISLNSRTATIAQAEKLGWKRKGK